MANDDDSPLFSYNEALELNKEVTKLVQIYGNRLEAIQDFVSGFRDRNQSIDPKDFQEELIRLEQAYPIIL